MNKKIKYIICLHIMLFVYSLSSVFSKLASKQDFLSLKFILFYGLVILLLGIYAVVWQQIIKNMQLSFAFANKAITVVWGLIWGLLIFGEKITVGKCVGSVCVIFGIVLYSLSSEGKQENE